MNTADYDENSSPGTLPLDRRQFITTAAAAGSVVAVDLVDPSAADAAPDPRRVRLTVNGERHTMRVDNRTSLLDLLREQLHLTGTKKGCNQGACGACTILVNGKRITSCLTLAVMHDGADLTTIEGADHPLQQAFIDHDGFQCGYCTPGQIMSGIGCIQEGHTGSDAEIREWMSGNICRCGCYPHIVAAIKQASRKPE
ncbi:(2Fe-2S)-binding protein [Kibdelosporangium aridum]|uniref:Xanthine dehydrogenase YagT iron-sulfur-binding subunit n=1 Tax=Kibdelosporangium aridum TaxID=2030 RepID=A0A1W1ZG39_KIBAR|nr:(2Fe-2S)-binding protein [Kibdelosporangium aridum]SMC47374.1 xanthine dehydrogenase YagT iron-sulfur-binding subunit [Kibdelosporangium aridum]